MAKGIVKWFDDARGYGFITLVESGEDVFAHFSAIHMEGRKRLYPGQKVSFEVVQGPKGLQASHIRVIGPGTLRRKRRTPRPDTVT